MSMLFIICFPRLFRPIRGPSAGHDRKPYSKATRGTLRESKAGKVHGWKKSTGHSEARRGSRLASGGAEKVTTRTSLRSRAAPSTLAHCPMGEEGGWLPQRGLPQMRARQTRRMQPWQLNSSGCSLAAVPVRPCLRGAVVPRLHASPAGQPCLVCGSPRCGSQPLFPPVGQCCQRRRGPGALVPRLRASL